MLSMFVYMLRNQKGQGMVEYGLIIALVAVLLIGGLTTLEGNISTTFSKAAASL